MKKRGITDVSHNYLLSTDLKSHQIIYYLPAPLIWRLWRVPLPHIQGKGIGFLSRR